MISFIHRDRTYLFRNPEFGNTNELSFQRVNRSSRGGDLILFSDADWPKTEALSLTFSFAEEVDMRRFIELLKVSVGEQIAYIDHEATMWNGVFQTPEAVASQVGRNSYEITVIYEGDQVMAIVTSVNGQTGVVILTAADVGAEQLGAVVAALAAHVAEADPHTQYLLETVAAVTYQPVSDDLTAIDALTTAPFGRSLLEATSGPTAYALLGPIDGGTP